MCSEAFEVVWKPQGSDLPSPLNKNPRAEVRGGYWHAPPGPDTRAVIAFCGVVAPEAQAPTARHNICKVSLTLLGTQSKPTRLAPRCRLRPRPMLGCRSLARAAAWHARCPHPDSTLTGRASTIATVQVTGSS